MKNLVFRALLVVTVCWQVTSAERSANGYFYDKPEGTLFDESPTLSQVTNSVTAFPPVEVTNNAIFSNQVQAINNALLSNQVQSSNNALVSNQVLSTAGYYPQLLNPLTRAPAPPIQKKYTTYEIVPAKLIYEDTQSLQPRVNLNLQQQSLSNVQNIGFQGQSYTQPIAFSLADSTPVVNNVQRPCGSAPIVAQFNPASVDLSNGGPLTRLITTCGPNNDCATITLQSDLNRQLSVFPSQEQQINYFRLNQAPVRTSAVFLDKSPVVRPKDRRLIEYNEIQQDDSYN